MSGGKGGAGGASGITMIEAMITIGIIGFIMSLIVVMAHVGVTAWKRQYVRLKLEQDGQSVMNHLALNLRQAQANSVVISRWGAEMDYSLISFDMVGKSDFRHYYFLRTLGSGPLANRSIVYSMPRVDALGNTRWSDTTLASNVVHVFFTFPNYNNRTQVLANFSMRRIAFQDKPPVVVQVRELVYARD
jgi:Tfp pilus assembly protein PilE